MTQRGEATCPGSHSREVAGDRRLNPWLSDPRAHEAGNQGSPLVPRVPKIRRCGAHRSH